MALRIDLENVGFGIQNLPMPPVPPGGDMDDGRDGKVLMFQDQQSGIVVRVPLTYKAVKEMRKQLAEKIEVVGPASVPNLMKR